MTSSASGRRRACSARRRSPTTWCWPSWPSTSWRCLALTDAKQPPRSGFLARTFHGHGLGSHRLLGGGLRLRLRTRGRFFDGDVLRRRGVDQGVADALELFGDAGDALQVVLAVEQDRRAGEVHAAVGAV